MVLSGIRQGVFCHRCFLIRMLMYLLLVLRSLTWVVMLVLCILAALHTQMIVATVLASLSVVVVQLVVVLLI